ncbi:hypothetical protein [Sphingobacterium yanglingense]|uniref:Uncharacterized protein n=1 Tax=Sphingobacterium yanglingense TaxID=1437280 RepID=A0A4R6W4A6_9SPHI|nr:hypothetical protein [Sphingobacterium yanglingense]TDQ73417.1 hypothetical protein CLV99_4469 [Sphingobacterium yanglingense]
MENLTEKELLEIQGGGIIGKLIKATANAILAMAENAIDNWRGPNA